MIRWLLSLRWLQAGSSFPACLLCPCEIFGKVLAFFIRGCLHKINTYVFKVLVGWFLILLSNKLEVCAFSKVCTPKVQFLSPRGPEGRIQLLNF